MNIISNIEITDLFLYLANEGILVIGDAHLGYEESLTKQGVLLPKFQFKEIIDRTKKALELKKPDKIIVVGDLKHEFGTISREEWRQVSEFLDLLMEFGEVILIRGNHDVILKPIADKKNLELKDYFYFDGYYFCHGHEIPDDLDFEVAETIIMGHEHPAIGLRDGPRYEVFKCFLKGKYKKKNLIVMPSLSSMPEGTDVAKEKLLSPLIKNIGDFEAFVVEDKTYNFGKIKNMPS